jgi:hypothetical protein
MRSLSWVVLFAVAGPLAQQEKVPEKNQEKVQEKSKESAPPAAAAKVDALVLKDGKRLSGTLLDIAPAQYVLRTSEGKVFVSRDSVASMERANDPGLSLFFKNAESASKSADDWRKLAGVCARKGAIPEERECWRRLLRLTADDADAHAAIGEALFGGKWLPENEVEERLKAGYHVAEGKLSKEPTTVVASKKASGAESSKEKSGASGKEKASKEDKKNAWQIRAMDHLKNILEEKDAHSLWMLLCRSGLRTAELDGKEGRVTLKFAQEIIDRISKRKGDYKANMQAYLNQLGAPKDWKTLNDKKIEEFLRAHRSGIHRETRFYHILSTASQEMTNELAQKMDVVTAQVYHKIFEFEEKISYKYLLMFWKDRNEFIRYGGSPMAAAYYRPDTKELVGYNLRADGESRMDPFQTLFHEGWHQYFDFYIPNAPRWFDEGFAEVISPTVVKGDRANWKGFNALRSSIVGQAATRGQLIPLRDLIKMSHEEFYSPNVVSIAYAQAWSFVYFLTTYTCSDRKIQERVRNFYKDYFWELHRGTDPVEAVDIVFQDVRFDTLEAAWIQAIPRQK